MNKQYLINSERLGLRNWLDSDLTALTALCQDETVMEYFPEVLTKRESANLLNHLQNQFKIYGFTYFAVELLKTGEFLGFAGLLRQNYEAPFTPCFDIGWRLFPQYWGKGYATEAAHAALDYVFAEKDVHEVYSVCPAINKASEAVMKELGMRYVGSFKHPALEKYPDLEECLIYKIERE